VRLVPDDRGEPPPVPRLRAVVSAKDEQIASLTASVEAALAALEGERGLRRSLELRAVELERLSMGSSDSGTPGSEERIGAREARRGPCYQAAGTFHALRSQYWPASSRSRIW
jgi:hypothetical protein